MANPIEKFFEEYPIPRGEYEAIIREQKNTLCDIARILGIETISEVKVIGQHVIKSKSTAVMPLNLPMPSHICNLPIVQYMLPNGSYIIIKDDLRRAYITVSSKSAIDPKIMEKCGADIELQRSDAMEDIPAQFFDGPYKICHTRFTTNMQSTSHLLDFVHHFRDVNTEPTLAPVAAKEETKTADTTIETLEEMRNVAEKTCHRFRETSDIQHLDMRLNAASTLANIDTALSLRKLVALIKTNGMT